MSLVFNLWPILLTRLPKEPTYLERDLERDLDLDFDLSDPDLDLERDPDLERDLDFERLFLLWPPLLQQIYNNAMNWVIIFYADKKSRYR